jgi:hypothetical protein
MLVLPPTRCHQLFLWEEDLSFSGNSPQARWNLENWFDNPFHPPERSYFHFHFHEFHLFLIAFEKGWGYSIRFLTSAITGGFLAFCTNFDSTISDYFVYSLVIWCCIIKSVKNIPNPSPNHCKRNVSKGQQLTCRHLIISHVLSQLMLGCAVTVHDAQWLWHVHGAVTAHQKLNSNKAQAPCLSTVSSWESFSCSNWYDFSPKIFILMYGKRRSMKSICDISA